MTWRAVYVLLGGLTGGVLSLAALIIREPASFVASFAGFILTVGGSFGLIYGGLCLLSFVSCILCYRLK